MANNALTLTQVNRYIALLTSSGVPRDALLAAITAAGTSYSPNDDLDWTIPAPSQVNEAIDELTTTARGGLIGVSGVSGASPMVADTPGNALVPVKSGRYVVVWQFAWNASLLTNCTCTPRIDGVDQTGDARNVVSPQGNSNVVIPALVTVNRAASHSVGWKWTYGTGAFTAGVGRMLYYEL